MQDINSVKKRFFTINKDRLSRTRDTLRPRQREVMDLLPLLFHYNHPSFPGFVSKETPAGISEYSPTKRSLDACKNLVPGFDFKSRALARYDLSALFLMGSCGSIAFSSDSDFDIWLCHRPDLNQDQLTNLQSKATGIEIWAASYNLEVHFFLMDAEKFKAGETIELSSESSGSAQHQLLLDEFYRTSILFAGRFPAWWLVPPGQESQHDIIIKNLLEKRFIRDGEIIDFGSIPESPVQEFFGAALWQLYKSIDSPYKALLKLMLMEVYASEYPDTNLLSTQFKQMVYDGEKNPIKLDAYMILYLNIDRYLRYNGDENRLRLVRQCFYFKSNHQLSTLPERNRQTWQQGMMLETVTLWGWNISDFITLDSRANWKVDRVIKERNNLISALTQSYRFLSNFARQTVKLSDINQKDLNILGRKLYSAFERKSGKIELVNRGISDDIHETHLTFYQFKKGGKQGWSIFQGAIYSDDIATTKPLKRSRSLVELIAWCFLNKLLNDRTAIAIFSRDAVIRSRDINAIIRVLNISFPNSSPRPVTTDDLLRQPKIINVTVFANIGSEPSIKLLSNGMQMTSNRVDALSYSGIGLNLLNSIDVVTQNSWQEIMSHHYEGEAAILDFISSTMQHTPPGGDILPPDISVDCFTVGRGMSISQRITDLYNEIRNCYYTKQLPTSSRYVLSIAKHHYVTYIDQGMLKYHLFTSFSKLLNFLQKPSPVFSPLVIDKNTIGMNKLPIIYKYNKAGVIQFFIHDVKNIIECYILDENGSLFYQSIKNINERIILNHFKRFLDSVIYRQHMHSTETGDTSRLADYNSLEIYQLQISRDGKDKISTRTVNQGRDFGGYFNLQVIADVDEAGNKLFTIYFDQREYTTLEFGDKVFEEAAKYVILKRQGNTSYPIYITDLDLSRRLVGKKENDYIQTIHYLHHKKEIEERFNLAILTLAKSSNNKKTG